MQKIFLFLGLTFSTINYGVVTSLTVFNTSDSKKIIIIGNKNLGIELDHNQEMCVDSLHYSWLMECLMSCAEIDQKTALYLDSSASLKEDFITFANNCIIENDFINPEKNLGTFLRLPLFAFDHDNIYKSLLFFHADMRSQIVQTPISIFTVLEESNDLLQNKDRSNKKKKGCINYLPEELHYIKKRVELLTPNTTINEYLSDLTHYYLSNKSYKKVKRFFTNDNDNLDQTLQDFFLEIIDQQGLKYLKSAMIKIFFPIDNFIKFSSFKINMEQGFTLFDHIIISCAQEEATKLASFAQDEQCTCVYTFNAPSQAHTIDTLCDKSTIEKAFSYILKRCAYNKCNALELSSKSHKCCSQCKTVSYCSKDCQRADWIEHKFFCKSVTDC